MNGAHLHLLATHVPALGVILGSMLLGLGLWRSNRLLQRTALAVFVVSALATGTAYLTGEGAEEAVEHTIVGTGGHDLIEQHEDAARYGLIVTGIAAVLALSALVAGRGTRALPRALLLANLTMGVFASGTLAWVANLGGRINHPEIRSAQQAGGDAGHEDGDEDDH